MEKEHILSNLTFTTIFQKVLALDNSRCILLESSAMSWFLLNQKMLAMQANKGIKTKECIYLPHSHGSVYTVTGKLLEKGTEKHCVDCGRSQFFSTLKKEIRLNKALHYGKHTILKQEKKTTNQPKTLHCWGWITDLVKLFLLITSVCIWLFWMCLYLLDFPI